MAPNLKPKLKIITEQPLNAETPASAWLEKETPNSLFYVRNHFDIPELSAESWKLKVIGEVETERSFSLEQIKSLQQSKQRVLLECAGNGRSTLEPPIKGTVWGFGAVAQAEFTGTALSNLLELVSANDRAIEALFIGADQGKVRTGDEIPYARSMPLSAANVKDVLLAWGMNGEALPPEHGFPLRLIVPREYGMSSVKWLAEIQLIANTFQGFFQADDYVYVQAEGFDDGTPVSALRVRSLFASHQDGQEIQAGRVSLQGIAWSSEGNVEQVEVSLDDGNSWQLAHLKSDPDPYTWDTWSITVDLAQAREYTLAVRASDSAGNQQPLQQYWNKGGYGNNIVQRIKVIVK